MASHHLQDFEPPKIKSTLFHCFPSIVDFLAYAFSSCKLCLISPFIDDFWNLRGDLLKGQNWGKPVLAVSLFSVSSQTMASSPGQLWGRVWVARATTIWVAAEPPPSNFSHFASEEVSLLSILIYFAHYCNKCLHDINQIPCAHRCPAHLCKQASEVLI